MTPMQHGARIIGLMILAAGLLGCLAKQTKVMFADGLRYVHQAQQIDDGSLVNGLLKAVDHPVYPLAIVAAHHEVGGHGPTDWQKAAQLASVLAGILLVVPVYLVALELFGPTAAWLGVILTYAAPLTGHVLADALSEGTFLLFWTWGLWCALRFLKRGTFGWLPPTIGFSALAYLTRPEGLLLPAALVLTLGVMPLLRSTRMNWPRWWAAMGVLVIGPACLVGPYIAIKGGLGTKPAIQRFLGTAPKSAADAVERQRPLPPDQSTAKTYALAAKEMFESVRDAVTVPLLPLALVGLLACRSFKENGRAWLLVGTIITASVLALIRLHATGGYCTPRHAMVLALLLIPAAALGLDRVLRSIAIPGRWLGLGDERFKMGPAIWVLTLAGFFAWYGGRTIAPLNLTNAGYRLAGNFILGRTAPGEPVVDVTGLAAYYGDRPAYTFATLVAAPADPRVRYVIAREAHLNGPWTYSARLRALVADRHLVKVFPEQPDPNQSKVYVFESREPAPAQAAMGPAGQERQ